MKSTALPRLFYKMKVDSAEEFLALYNTFQSLVSTVIYQMLGSKISSQVLNDLVQETFIKIWKGLPEFRNEAELKSWIYKITINTGLDYLKSAPVRKEIFNHSFESFEMEQNSEQRLANEQIVSLGLSSLSHDHRMVLVLVFIHELSLQEVAEILQVPLGTVKSRAHHAKEKFKEILVQKGVVL